MLVGRLLEGEYITSRGEIEGEENNSRGKRAVSCWVGHDLSRFAPKKKVMKTCSEDINNVPILVQPCINLAASEKTCMCTLAAASSQQISWSRDTQWKDVLVWGS